MIVLLNQHNPRDYNDILMWSVLGFLGLFGIIYLFRHMRYLRLVRDHWLELEEGKLRFHSQGSDSELNLRDEVAAIRFFRGKGGLLHIQIILKNNRGIRLESYSDLEGLAKALADQVPKGIIMDK
jgi:hypothetical protein